MTRGWYLVAIAASARPAGAPAIEAHYYERVFLLDGVVLNRLCDRAVPAFLAFQCREWFVPTDCGVIPLCEDCKRALRTDAHATKPPGKKTR